MDPNADYDEQYDGVPTNSLQKELDSNYERETRLKRYKRIQEPSDEDDELISIPTPILEQIEQEKAQRQNERLSIQQDKEILARREKYLEDAKKEIDQARNDLDVREIKILQVEPLLPLARQLQELSLGFDDIIPWIEMIREKAHIENIDLKNIRL